RGHCRLREAPHGVGDWPPHRRDCGYPISHVAADAQCHETTVAQARSVNAASVDGVLQGELVQHLVEKGNIIRRLRPVLLFLRILSSALTASGIPATATTRVTAATPRISATTTGVAATTRPASAASPAPAAGLH